MNMTRMATALLQHGADPYALFHQSVRIYNYWSSFPGETQDDKVIDERFVLGITQIERRNVHEAYLLRVLTRKVAFVPPLKGLDPMVRNTEGETAIDVAIARERHGESLTPKV
ncbi:hypothetical protein GB937_009862 [Aspergillus fischeri]|nr:hypothetical protein GB937_009862 [Aspergillus fischeri]